MRLLTPAGLDQGLINLSVLSWPTCPSPGGTAALPAKRSSQDTTHTASVPAACSARPMRSCECATVGWCTCLVRSPLSTHLHRAQQVSREKNTQTKNPFFDIDVRTLCVLWQLHSCLGYMHKIYRFIYIYVMLWTNIYLNTLKSLNPPYGSTSSLK